MSSDVSTLTLTIANGAALSDAARVRYLDVVGLVLPGAWTAAGIGFAVSYDNGTTYVYVRRPEVHTANAPLPLKVLEILAADVPTAESVFIPLQPEWFAGATHLKVRSQTANVAVNQGAARSVLIVTRDRGV